MLCGRFFIQGSYPLLLLRLLPARLIVQSREPESFDTATPDAGEPGNGSTLSRLIEVMHQEALGLAVGSEDILDRLSTALFALALRQGMLAGDAPRGLLALLRNRVLLPALAVLIEQPEVAWTLPRLAELCGVSRATFIRQFNEAVGQSAIDLLTEIRMAVAIRKLESTRMSTGEIARSVGYQSDAAFKRAFKNFSGFTPARWRTQVPSKL